jgi:alkylation response protein AidB-like acyl-CoA dehydrogenase
MRKYGSHLERSISSTSNWPVDVATRQMRIEACRYMTWKACQQYDLSKGSEHELAVMTKVFCSETCVDVVYDAMRLVGVDSYTDMHPLAELMNDAMCFRSMMAGMWGLAAGICTISSGVHPTVR